jgi:AcrR family transcriptional regulator
MPKVVDHQARRRELVDALLRVVVRDGFDAVSIRTVADEAGCSVRPVQYYFESKAQLLAAAHRRVTERMGALIAGAVAALGQGRSPRAVVEAVVHSFLPTTDEARHAVIAYHCFFAAELTDTSLRVPSAAATPDALAQALTAQLERHWRRPPTSTDKRDIQLLVTSLSTIAASVIAGYRPLAEAKALLDHQIDRLLASSAP